MRRILSLLLAACLITAGAGAWGYWSAGSGAGGNGAAASTSVNQGATPTASAAGNSVTVSWAPTTLTTGQAVSGYVVKRYSGSTAQTILSACTGTITGTSCVETNVPTGVWTYSVTPVFATNWVGVESAKSSNVVVGNVAPAAVADNYTVAEDAVLTVAATGVLGNDSDPNSDPLTAILAGGVANGTVTLNANGGFTYTPNPDFNGSDSFSYKANDGVQDSNVVTVTVTVAAVNDAPVNAVPGPQQTPMNTNRVFSTANNNPVSISDVDASGSVQVQLTATSGTVTLPVLTGLTFSAGDGTSDTTMTFTGTRAAVNTALNGATFIPTNNSTGAATLQIVSSDQGSTGSGGTKTDSDTVTINVNSLGIFTTNQDIGASGGSSTYSTGTYTVKGSGADIWGTADQFQYLYRTLPGDGRLTAKVVSSTQTPSDNAQAKAGVMLRETIAVGSRHAYLNIMKTSGSEFLWRTSTDGVTTAANTGVLAAPYWVRITRVGDVITAQRSPDGVTWTTEGGAQTVAMTASITVGLAVTAHDNARLSTVIYDNVALTTPPTAVGGTYVTNEDTTLNVAAPVGVLANDTDPESNALNAVLVSGTTGLTLNADGSFTYVPPANFTGAASFTYKANDGVFDSNTVTVNLTVNPANEVPSFTKGANQSVSAGSAAQTVAGWASAISQGAGEAGQLVDFVVTNDNNALFSVQPAVSAAGALTYTPAGATGAATVSVRIHDNGGTANGGTDTSAIQTFTITLTPDTVGPTGGSVDASGLAGTGSRYAASTTLSLVLAKGTDPSGVATTGNLLKRATATLTSGGTANGTCGAYGAYSLVSGGTDPVSPKSDTVTDQACYRYQYVVLDTLGNPTTYTSPDIKVDLTAPAAPTLAHSAFTNTYWASGATVYYRSAAASGSFTTTSTAADTTSGIVSHAFPALGTNWTSTPGATGVTTYSWSSAPAVPGTKTVTATNHAAVVSGTTSFTPTADDTAPSAGTVTPPNATQAGTSVSVAYTTGTDGGSGLGTRLLQRKSATLTGTTCGSYGGWTTATTDPGSSPVNDTVTAGFCYQYQYVVADNVNNTHTATSTNVVKVPPTYSDTILATSGLVSFWRLGEALSTSPMVDSKGTNNGTYFGTLTMGVAGAIAGSNTAVQFDGVDDYGSAARQISDNFSIEFWFKSTQSYYNDWGSPHCTQWWQGAGLVDAETSGASNDFGVSLCDGRVVAGAGTPDVSVVSAAGMNNGAWHHVVFTRTMSTGAMQLYVDGVSAGTATGSTASLNSSSTISFGKIQGASQYYAGSMDEVAVYSTVLSGATASGHYQSGTGGPTGGSVDASGLVGTSSRYATSTTLSLDLAKGTDPDGVATTGNLLKRATATLTSGGTANGTCGAFGTYTLVSGGTDPVSPKSDFVTDQACYRYQYVVLDTLSNPTTYTSPDIKVDLTAPAAPTLAHSAFTNTYWSSGAVVYYRSAAASGSFTTTSTASDNASGIASHTFPTLGTNWTSTPGASGVTTYSWSGAPAAPGAKTVTATNHATVTSGATSFTPTADDTAPSAGTVTPPNATQTSTTVSVAYTTGTDGGSGLGTRLLQRRSATLTGTTCGTYGGWTTVATNPGSSPVSDTVTAGYCYQYQYVVSDNVANTHTATSTNVVKVTAASSTLKAQYKNNEPAAPTDNSIQPHLQLVNTSASGVDLSTITIRYWFTKEAGASTFAAPCFYADVGCSNVSTSVVAVTPRTGADSYLVVGFASSTLAAGASSQVQLGLNKTDWSVFNEVDDYSYGTGTSYVDSTKVTVYQGGTLIWGTEP